MSHAFQVDSPPHDSLKDVCGMPGGSRDGVERWVEESSVIPSNVAMTVLEKLQMRNRMVIFDGIDEELPFLSMLQQREAQQIVYDHDTMHADLYLSVCIGGKISDLIMSRLPQYFELVNSSGNEWLPHWKKPSGNSNTGPTQFIAPFYLVRYRHPFHRVLCDPIVQCGEFPIRASRGSLLAILDANAEVDDSSMGEYLMHLMAASESDSDTDTTELRGMIYDAERAYLVTAVCGHIHSVTRTQWTTPGSLRLIVEFLTPRRNDPAHIALRMAQDGLQVAVTRYRTAEVPEEGEGSDGRCCILGEGAFGRVYRVTRQQDQQVAALKVVHGDAAVAALQQECALLRSLPADCRSYVVGVVDGSLWTAEVAREGLQPLRCAAFLMPVVGRPFSHPSEVSASVGLGMLLALSGIHATGVVHGDARFANAVVVRQGGITTYRWVDLRPRSTVTTIGIAQDVQIFFGSLRGKVDMPSAEAVNAYARAVGTWSTAARVIAVQQMYSKSRKGRFV